MEPKEIKYKLILLGDENVGKTSIINRFKNNKYKEDYEPTVGLDFQSKSIFIDNINIKLLLYDTAGQEKFRSLISLYTREAKIIFFIYDITNSESFLNIEKWYNALTNINKDEVIFFLIGNKIDLINERKVQEEEGKTYAESHDFFFQEVSALTGEGIDDLFFKKLSTQIKTQLLNDKNYKDQEEERLKVNLNEIKGNKEKNIRNKSKKCCCCAK